MREVIPQGFTRHSWNLDSTLSGAPKPDVVQELDVQVMDFGFQILVFWLVVLAKGATKHFCWQPY